MPFSLEQLEDSGFCRINLSGEITTELLIDLMDAILEDATYQRTQAVILCAGEQLRLNEKIKTMREVESYARSNDHRFTGSKWAVVTPAKIHYGLARMYQAWRDDASYQVAAFRRLPDAVAWLSE